MPLKGRTKSQPHPTKNQQAKTKSNIKPLIELPPLFFLPKASQDVETINLFRRSYQYHRLGFEVDPFGSPKEKAASKSPNHLVFVYGTLKKGFYNHDRGLAGELCLGQAHTLERFPLVVDEYFVPYLLNLPGKGSVIKGEVYHVDAATLQKLDQIENYPRYYDRVQIHVADPRLANTTAWVYVKKSWQADLAEQQPLSEYTLTDHKQKYVPRYLRDASHISRITATEKELAKADSQFT